MNKYILLLLSVLLLTACKSADVVITNEQEAYSYQVQAHQELKAQAISNFNWFGMGLFATGLGMLAFTSKKIEALVFVAGGGLLMSSLWVLDSEWFPWIAGTAVAIAFADGLYALIRKTLEAFKSQP